MVVRKQVEGLADTSPLSVLGYHIEGRRSGLTSAAILAAENRL